jgi:hypothetical protein
MGTFIPGRGREPMNLSESEIRYAMMNTKSNQGAARFLKVSYETYRKYAKQYLDSASGKSLFELHKNISGKGIIKTPKVNTRVISSLQDIFDGLKPNYPVHKLKHRLIRHGFMEEKCALCGFHERRVQDYSVPLLLDFIDGDRSNYAIENLQLLCYNCTYLTSHNTLGGRPKKLSC